MLMPNIADLSLRLLRRCSPSMIPLLLKPYRLITALSDDNLNTRGRGLPAWGFRVSVPASTNPGPSWDSWSKTSPSLSKPAARPIGFRNLKSKTFEIVSDSSLPFRPFDDARPNLSSLMVVECAVSAGRCRSNRSEIVSNSLFMRIVFEFG